MKHVLDDHEPVIGRAGLFSLGLIALFASAILYNAFIAQSAPHPAPMASGWVVENSGEAVQLRARDVALKSDNESHSEGRGRVMMEIPAPRQQEAATGRPDNRSLIHSIQTELAAFGLYEDAIDGLAGPRTRDAIHVYQRSMGLQATGEADRKSVV